MACKTETTTIGDNEYSVTQWPASKAISIKLRLIKTFGPSLAIIASHLSNDTKKKKVSSEEESAALSEGISLLFRDNSVEEVSSLLKECVIGVARNGTKITQTSYDEIFSGEDLMDVYKVFFFVVRVNYADLMKGQLVDGLLAKIQHTV